MTTNGEQVTKGARHGARSDPRLRVPLLLSGEYRRAVLLLPMWSRARVVSDAGGSAGHIGDRPGPEHGDEPVTETARFASTKSEHMPSAERLRELLVGKKVTEARLTDDRAPSDYGGDPGPTGYLTLSDGAVLAVWGNDGGCACSAGCYPLAELNAVDNVITNVEVEDHPDGDDVGCPVCGELWCYGKGHPENEGYYRIFVFAENQRINLASFEGSDGNGYYGTGWWLRVGEPA